MLDMFKIPYMLNPSTDTPYRWGQLEYSIKQNVQKAIEYYRSVPSYINSRHILVRYLSSLVLNYHVDTYAYYNEIKRIALSKTQLHGFTSSYNTGVVHEGNFFGDDNEIIIATAGDYDPLEVSRNWKDIQSVKVLRHDYSGISYHLPRGLRNLSIGSVSVIEVDVVLLLLQYRMFILEQETFKEAGGEMLSINNFVIRYPIPNMLWSNIDQYIFNHYRNMLNLGDIVDIGYPRLPFNVLDISKTLVESCQIQVDRLKKGNLGIANTLANINLISTPSALTKSKLPNMVINKQCEWANLFSILPILKTGIMLADGNLARNSTWLANLDSRLRYIEKDASIYQSRIRNVSNSIMREIDEIRLITGLE